MRTARFPRGSDDAHLLIGRSMGQIIRRENITESYVRIPPALWINDTQGAIWTIGFEYNVYMEYSVLRNDVDTGEFASVIDWHRTNTGGLLRIYSRAGTKTLARSGRGFI